MNKTSPKVSIVLPTFNGVKYIQQSIESCLNQTYKNIELIIVDDGSTDETPEIIKSYDDTRIRYIKHEKNKGLPHALNTGFAYTMGEYLTWTSDDNYYAKQAIEKMLSFLLDKNCSFVYSNFCRFCEENPDKLDSVRLPDVLELEKRNDVGACFLYTRKLKETIRDFDINAECAEDYDYWLRVSKKFSMYHLDENLYFYRQHTKAISISRFYEVRVVSILVRIKNEVLNNDAASKSLVGLSAKNYPRQLTKCFRLFRLNYLLAKIVFSRKIEKVLKDLKIRKITFKDAKLLLLDIVKGD